MNICIKIPIYIFVFICEGLGLLHRALHSLFLNVLQTSPTSQADKRFHVYLGDGGEG
jgi:hypothetical protein